jgi:hypothetical protein
MLPTSTIWLILQFQYIYLKRYEDDETATNCRKDEGE